MLVSQPVCFWMSSKGRQKKPIGAKRFFWLSMTPLLRPVVPEVKRMRESASRSSQSAHLSLQAEVL